MTVKSIRIHDAEQEGAGLYSYGDGEFKVQSTNALLQSAAHINSTGHGWTSSGTDIGAPVFTTTLPAEFVEDNAEVVNSGVLSVEWTGTGASEQVQSPIGAAMIQNDQVDFGAWVYLESAGTARNVEIQLQSYNGADTFLQAEGVAPVSVTPGEWTLLTGTAVVAAATTAAGRIVIEQNGNQLSGDKLYVGMAFINVNKNDQIPRPSTLMDERFRLTATLQQIGGTNNAGTIAQSLSGDWQVNAGFDGNYATINYVNSVGGNAYSVTTGVELDVEEVYEIEVLHVYDTGLFEFALIESGVRTVIHTETLTATTGLPPLASYGLDIMPDNWGILYELTVYDAAGPFAQTVPATSLDVYTTGTTEDLTPVATTQQAAAKNNLIIERDMFEVSRNFIGAAEFSIAKADRPGIDFSGDFFVACSLQTRNDAAVDIVSSHSGTEGFRLSTVAGTSPAQEWEAVFDDGTGNVTQAISTVLNDGEHHFIGVQREAGVQYDIYSDDFYTAAQTVADGLGSLDGASTLDILSEWQGAFGALVIFTRTLTEDERLEISDWMEYGAQYDGTPDFVDGAVLHVNPSAPVQKSAIKDRKLVNLAHRPNDTLWVRYTLTTSDGSDNPSLDSVHLEIPSIEQGLVPEKEIGPLDIHDGWLFSGHQHLLSDYRPTQRELNDFSWTLLSLFTKNSGTGEEEIFSSSIWRLFHNGTSFVFEQNSTPVDTTAHSLSNGETYLVTLRRTGANLELAVNGTTISTFAHTFSGVTPANLEFGKNLYAVVHTVAVLQRYLRPAEEGAIMTALEDTPDFGESVQVSETFDYVELNWG